MGYWKDLPHEIVIRIAQILNDDAIEKKWMFTNKGLYNYKKSIDYKRISIDLIDPSDKILDAIFHSPFQPGKWVKEVQFMKFVAPEKLDGLNRAVDPLYQLMKYCPNVKEVSYPIEKPSGIKDLTLVTMAPVGVKEWAYFSAVLMDSNVWKLDKLPAPQSKKRQFLHYYKCALHMRDSLTKLNLALEMIDKEDYNYLSEFNQLTDLDVGKNILKGLYDCDNMLKHLPHLSSLKVESFQPVNDDDVDIECAKGNSSQITAAFNGNNVKDLVLPYYPSWKDKELLHLMDSYAKLEQLDMRGAVGVSSKMISINAAVMKSFIEFTLKIKQSSIIFDGFSSVDWLIDMYRDHPTNFYQKLCKLQLSINLVEKDRSLASNSKFDINLAQKSNPPEALIMITYDMNDEPSARKIALKTSLSHVHNDIETVSLNLSTHLIQTGEYIDALLGRTHENLKSVEVIGGLLYKYSNTQDRFCRGQHINELRFKQIHIAERVLPVLSKEFPYLKSLAFDCCDFGTTRNNIDISMINTDVGTLDIQGKDITGSAILLKLYKAGKNVLKCYFDVTLSEPIEEISEKKLDVLMYVLKLSAFTIISIRVKSIEKLSFKAFIKGELREINLPFP